VEGAKPLGREADDLLLSSPLLPERKSIELRGPTILSLRTFLQSAPFFPLLLFRKNGKRRTVFFFFSSPSPAEKNRSDETG